MTIKSVCHCGNIEISVDELPEYLGDCNCSICNRYKALWAYYPPNKVSVIAKGGGTSKYIWGDKEVEFHSCKNCGCIVHYLTTNLCPEKIIAINFRMVDSSIYKGVTIKKINGAGL